MASAIDMASENSEMSPGVLGTNVGGSIATNRVPAKPYRATNFGVFQVVDADTVERMEADARREADEQQNQPIIQGLAQYVRGCWQDAKDARNQKIDERLAESVRARRGEYDSQRAAMIAQEGGSDVYAKMTSVKCRAAASWLRDILATGGTDKPWTIKPTPVPDLPADMKEQIIQQVTTPIMVAQQEGLPLTDEQIKQLMEDARAQIYRDSKEKARQKALRMEEKMEDQLVEGGFLLALTQFIEDIVTFPAAVIKGPVVRNKNKLVWETVSDNKGQPVQKVTVQKYPCLHWERVSPFDIYPSAESEGIQDGYLIEKHRLSRRDLLELKGIEGYNDLGIDKVLEDYGRGGLRDWLYDDLSRASAEGKATGQIMMNPDGLMDAIQFWGSVSGEMLIEFGMDKESVPDKNAEYSVEVWVIGTYVIKCVLNHHPLGLKPYYKASYEEIPGSFWGNSPCDLIRDAQIIVNAASRALVNNMSIASGPQVVINVDRLPVGEDVTQIYPWKIHQVTNDPSGNGAARPPIEFSQPKSNATELAGIIKMYMELADEWSGIPKYLTGDAPGGAGRTASGLSMLMTNAGKSLKQVVANFDHYVMEPLLQQLYFWNMRYSDDPELKGDVQIVARGANALVAKESSQQRRVEFLAATANPIDMQIVGLPGRAHVLREVIRDLQLDTDRIIPSDEELRQKDILTQALQKQQAIAQAQAIALGQGEAGKPPEMAGGVASQPSQATPAAPGGPSSSGQSLMDGTPTVDNFSPPSAPGQTPQM